MDTVRLRVCGRFGSGTYNEVVQTPFSAAVVVAGFDIDGRLFLGPRAPATDRADDGEEVMAFADGGGDSPDGGHLADEAVEVVVVRVTERRVVVAKRTPVTRELHFHEKREVPGGMLVGVISSRWW